MQTHDPKEEHPIEEIAKFKKRVGVFHEKEKMFSDSVPIKPQALMRELQECLPEDAIVFVDAGNHTCWAQHYLQVKKASITFALGLAAMRYATPATIGDKLAA